MKLKTKLLLTGIILVVAMTTVIIYVVNVKISTRERNRITSELLVSASNYEFVLNNKERELAIHIRTFFQDPLRLAEFENDQAEEGFRQHIEPYLKEIGYSNKDNFSAVFYYTVGKKDLVLYTYHSKPEEYLLESSQASHIAALYKAYLSNTIELPLNEVLKQGQLSYGKTLVLDGRLFRVQGIPIQAAATMPPIGAFFLFSEVTDSFAQRFILNASYSQQEPQNINLRSLQKTLGEKAIPETVFLAQGKAVATSNADLSEFTTKLTQFVQAQSKENEVREIILGSESYLSLWRPWTPQSGYFLLKSYDDAIAPLRALQRQLLILAIVVMFIALIVFSLLTRSLVLPIYRLVEGTQAVEAGNLETVVPLTSKDEIGHLTQSFNHMVSQVREKEKVEAMLAQKEIERQAILAQKEIERHRSISEMVTGVAHELNTPLGIVNSSADLIEMALDAETVSELAEGKDEDTEETLNDIVDASQLIQTNIERASGLVQRFKNLSVEQLTDTLETVDLNEKLDEQLMLYKLGARDSKLDIALESELAEKQWQGYPGYLFQIMQNLLSNIDSYAYPDKTGGKVVLTVKSTRVKGVPSFLISVQDFGAGMSEESVSRVFEAFYTTGRNQGGTGLGMAIVHNLVTSALKGSIEVSSQLGQGTTFTLCFPQTLTTLG
ncbi:MAG: HAMP domain-containing sensor histidine kinase [Pseudomonadota bacterium]